MKKVGKLATIALAAGMTFGVSLSAAGCSGVSGDQPTYDPVSPDSIKVLVSELGFGIEWAKAIGKAFMDTHPGKTVTVEGTVMSSGLISQMEAGGNIGDVCMFNDDALWSQWRKGTMTILNDVVEAIPDGETASVHDKMNATLIDAYRMSTGNYYSVPWINENCAMVYNASSLDKIFGAGNWELPKTTEELWTMCEGIGSKGYAFVWNTAYLGGDAWAIQYNGVDNDQKYNLGYYYDETDGNWKMSSEDVQFAHQNVGMQRSFAAWEKIIKKYSHKYANNMTHINAQASWAGLPYAGDSKPSVFMPNGDWTYNETKKYINETKAVTGFMKYPVISSIVEKMDLYEDGTTLFDELPAAKREAYDEKLRTIVDYADKVLAGETAEKPSGISDHDIDIVVEARGIIAGKSQAQAFIPASSKKVELAKEFLVFMASDMAIDIFSDYTYGFSPYISNEKIREYTSEIPFMTDVKNVILSSPVKNISVYRDIKTGGYYSAALGISFATDLAGAGGWLAAYEKGIDIMEEKWSTILKDADKKAGQLWNEEEFYKN